MGRKILSSGGSSALSQLEIERAQPPSSLDLESYLPYRPQPRRAMHRACEEPGISKERTGPRPNCSSYSQLLDNPLGMHGQLAQVGQPPFLKQRKMFGGRSRSRFRAEITANCAAPAASSRVLHKAERSSEQFAGEFEQGKCYMRTSCHRCVPSVGYFYHRLWGNLSLKLKRNTACKATL